MIFKIMNENRDIFEDEKFSRKIRKTENYTDEQLEELLPKMVHHFRVLDDDNTTYFWGVSSDDESFEPLDMIGVAYGCTQIQYKNKQGKYETL